MHRRPLHHDIAPLHELPLSRIQNRLHLPLEHNPVVDTLCPVHHALVLRREIHVAEHCAAAADKAELARSHLGGVRGDVGVGVDVGREGGGVGDAHFEFVVVVGFVVDGALGVHDGFAVGAVAGEVDGGGCDSGHCGMSLFDERGCLMEGVGGRELYSSEVFSLRAHCQVPEAVCACLMKWGSEAEDVSKSSLTPSQGSVGTGPNCYVRFCLRRSEQVPLLMIKSRRGEVHELKTTTRTGCNSTLEGLND